MKYCLYLSLVCCFCFACGNENNGATNHPFDENDSLQFYPLQTYFKLQINKADSNGHNKLQTIVYRNEKKIDTLSHESFYSITDVFSSVDVLESSKKQFYEESVFMDLTTNSYTFSYTTEIDSLPIKRIMILVDTATSLVKRVFITKQKNSIDSNIIEQLGWMHDSSFYINTSITIAGKKSIEKRINVTF